MPIFKFAHRQSAQGVVEYGLVIAVIALVVAAGARQLSGAESAYFTAMAPVMAPTPDLQNITALPALTATVTPTSLPATATPTGTITVTATATGTFTSTPTATPTSPPGSTPTPTLTPTATATATATPTPTTTGLGARTTDMTIGCSPSSVAAFATTSCTVTVKDAGQGSPSTPTGTVNWSLTSGPGSFAGSASCTLSAASGNSATCQVVYQPNAVGSGTHSLKATYAGDADHAANGAGATYSLTVTKATTSTTVAAASASWGDTAVFLTAHVSGPIIPSGGITFTVTSGTTPIGTATSGALDSNGDASVTYSLPGTVAPGSYTITARYDGNGDLSISSGSATLTLTKKATAISVAAAGGTYGSNVALSATLSSASVGLGGKTLTFVLNGTTVGSAVTLSSGQAVLTDVTLPASIGVGTYPTGLQVNFGSDPTYASSGGSASLTVGQAQTVTTNDSVLVPFGAPSVALNAAVAITPASSVVINQGNVTFTVASGANGVGTPASASVTGGIASASYALPSNLAPGTYTLDATYNGTANLGVSYAPTQTLTVVRAGTTTKPKTTLATYDDASVALTASVTANSPSVAIVNSGTATFSILSGQSPGSTIGTPVTATVSNGSVSTTYLLPPGTPAGQYTIAVAFSDGAEFADSSGSAVLTINKRPTSLTVAQASGTYGGSVYVAATLSAGGVPLDGRTISFTLPNATSSSVPTDSAGNAGGTIALSTGTLVGTYPSGVSATFAGDANYATSTSSAGLSVTQASTAIIGTNVSTSRNGANSGIFTLRADVSAVSPSTATVNAGTVTFSFTAKAGSPSTCTATVTNGVATVTTTGSGACSLPNGSSAGSYDINVGYADASGNYSGSTTKATLTVT